MRKWFEQTDSDRSGAIDANELQRLLQAAGSDYDMQTVDLMIDMFDKDNSKTINYHEFRSLYGYITEMSTAFREVGEDSLDERGVERALMNHTGFLNKLNNPAALQLVPMLVPTLFQMFGKGNGRLTMRDFMQLALFFGLFLSIMERGGMTGQIPSAMQGGKVNAGPPNLGGMAAMFGAAAGGGGGYPSSNYPSSNYPSSNYPSSTPSSTGGGYKQMASQLFTQFFK